MVEFDLTQRKAEAIEASNRTEPQERVSTAGADHVVRPGKRWARSIYTYERTPQAASSHGKTAAETLDASRVTSLHKSKGDFFQ